jgi:outer membrane protein OmpA-like peptidoglycan-associated protein
VLGAGWGAGAGAVIGNQTGNAGAGAGIGAGFGAVGGLVTGVGLDISEGTELREHRRLDALKTQTASNYRTLMAMQDSLDTRHPSVEAAGGLVEQVYFDENRASLRLGSAARLEQLADSIKNNPSVGLVELHGHSDDMGSAQRNERLSEARARTVATFLAAQGISVHQLKIISHGAMRPIASNENEAGRQLNRRVEVVLLR